MTTYGLTPTGFVRKPEAQIFDDIAARLRARVSPNIDLEPTSPDGQIIGIYARELGLLWEILENVTTQLDPDQAEDAMLESVCKLTGTAKEGATYSVISLNCTLSAGTTLLAGAHWAFVAGDPENRWTPISNYTADSSGVKAVLFRAENTGPINATSATVTVIATPVSGWTAVTNPNPPTVGQDVDTNATLRTRREASLTAAGSTTRKAIREAVLKVDGVIDCLVLANKDVAVTDANGVPPASIEVVVYDGVAPVAADNAIAQAIFDSIDATDPTFGSVTASATNEDDLAEVVKFSRVTIKNVWLIFTIQTGAGYVGDAAVKDYVVEQVKYSLDDDINALRLRSLPLALKGVVDVPDLKLGFAAAPTGTANLTVLPRELALLDASRISIVTV